MAKKKKNSVLDYDPLAWLNEADGEKASDQKASENKDEPVKAKAKAKVKAKPKAKAKAKAKPKSKAIAKPKAKAKAKPKAKPVEAKPVEAKPVEAKPVEAIPVEAKQPEAIENENFGFFEDDDKVDTKEQDSDQGFGFFVESDELKDQQKEEESEQGFGFFSASDGISNEPVVEQQEDQGFGFFDTDDVELKADVVNNETLDISSDEAVNLGSELTIKTVAVVKQQIEGHISADVDIVINAEEMIKIDTAGLQLLYSLKQSLAKTGHHIKWIGTSSVINDSAAVIGMPVLAPQSKEACYGFFEDENESKDADDGNSGFF